MDLRYLDNGSWKQVPPVKGTDDYPHMPILRPLASRRFVRFWRSEEEKFPKMGDSLPRTPLNHRAKFDAPSFILAGEIRNRTKLQTNKKHTNKITNRNRYIHTLPIGMCGKMTNFIFYLSEMWLYNFMQHNSDPEQTLYVYNVYNSMLNCL